MNVWFVKSDKPEECFECHERMEQGNVICKMLTHDRANTAFHTGIFYRAFHPECFPTWARKLFNEDKVRRSPARRMLVMKLNQTHRRYYQAIDDLPLTEWNKLYLYRLRKRAKRIYQAICEDGGPLVYMDTGAIWQRRGPLWRDDLKFGLDGKLIVE